MRKEILEILKVETKAAKRFLKAAGKRADEGKRAKAIELFDIGSMAKKIADKAHDDLWKEAKGKLTEEEFESFIEAETLRGDLIKAYQKIK